MIFFSNKMIIYFNVLGTCMIFKIKNECNFTLVITINNCGICLGFFQICIKSSKPNCFFHCMCHYHVFNLCALESRIVFFLLLLQLIALPNNLK